MRVSGGINHCFEAQRLWEALIFWLQLVLGLVFKYYVKSFSKYFKSGLTLSAVFWCLNLFLCLSVFLEI